MITLHENGSVSLAVDNQESRRSFTLTEDGVVIIGENAFGALHGPAIVGGGNSVALCRFDRGVLIREPVVIEGGRLQPRAESGATDTPAEDLDQALEHLGSQSSLWIREFLAIFFSSSRLHHPVTAWCDIIPRSLITQSSIDTLCRRKFHGEEVEIGLVKGRRVLIHRLPRHPPVGTVSFARGLRVKQTDVMFRKVERLLSIAELPPSILRPIGFGKLSNDEWCLVSEFPLTTADLADLETLAADSPYPTCLSLSSVVNSCHSVGLTFGGMLNPHAFLASSTGDLFLNTPYVLARVSDESEAFGCLSNTELRFIAPGHLREISRLSETLVQYMGLDVKLTTLVERDLFSVGRMLEWINETACGSLHPESLAEHILSSLSDSDNRGNIPDGACRLTYMAKGLQTGDMSISDVIRELSALLAYGRDETLQSVQSEAKAMWNMISKVIRDI
jgi:hypothetical protein